MTISHAKAAETDVSILVMPPKHPQELTAASGIDPQADFGNALKISADGSVLVVAARETNQVLVYVGAPGGWELESQLSAVAGAGQFGESIAVSEHGDLIAVGAHIEGHSGGKVYLYLRQARRWLLRETLCQGQPADRFGSALAMAADGQTLAVAAPNALQGKGAVYVYTLESGQWQAQVITQDDLAAEGGDFGRAVGLNTDGTVLAIGHPGYTAGDLASAGRVLIYEKNVGLWSQTPTQLSAPTDAEQGDQFGYTLAISGAGDRLAVGADGVATRDSFVNAGAVYLCARDEDDQWTILPGRQNPDHVDRTPHFGCSLAFDEAGELLIIGSWGGGTTNVSRAYGLAYSYAWGAAAKSRISSPNNSTLGDHSHFGFAVSISANGLCVAISATGLLVNDLGEYRPPISKIYLFGQPTPFAAVKGSSSVSGVPGVHAQETNQPLLSIPSGSTAIPVFIGVFHDRYGLPLSNETCIEIGNMADFRRRFGSSRPARVIRTADRYEVTPGTGLGSLALQLYFDNGGGRCYIMPLHDATSNDELLALPAKLRRFPDITLYAVTELPTDAPVHPACNALNPLLTQMGNGFLIADSADGITRPATVEQRTAVYFPMLQTIYNARPVDEDIDVDGYFTDGVLPPYTRPTMAYLKSVDEDAYLQASAALNMFFQGDNAVVKLPASVAVAGAYCRSDASRGVWMAPAGLTLNSVRGVYPEPKLDDLNELLDNRINLIRYVPSEGACIWGARTMEPPALPLWLPINVSRLFDAAARDIQRALQVVVFMPNNPLTWAMARSAIDSYLFKLWRDGGLKGATADEAYYVRVGRDTMSDEDLAEGRMVVLVGMAALRPVEFVDLVFSQVLTGA